MSLGSGSLTSSTFWLGCGSAVGPRSCPSLRVDIGPRSNACNARFSITSRNRRLSRPAKRLTVLRATAPRPREPVAELWRRRSLCAGALLAQTVRRWYTVAYETSQKATHRLGLALPNDLRLVRPKDPAGQGGLRRQWQGKAGHRPYRPRRSDLAGLPGWSGQDGARRCRRPGLRSAARGL
jgi:hypothetical protein